MFEHLLTEHHILMYEPPTVPSQELEADIDRIGLVLQQAKAIDGGAEDCRKVGIIGFVTRISGLAILFGGVGVKNADLEPRFDKGSLDWAVVAPRPLDDGDLVLDPVSCQGVADAPKYCLESKPVVLDDGRFHEDSTVEIDDHQL